MKYTCKSLKKYTYILNQNIKLWKQTHITYLYWATRTVILIRKNVLNLFDIYLLLSNWHWILVNTAYLISLITLLSWQNLLMFLIYWYKKHSNTASMAFNQVCCSEFELYVLIIFFRCPVSVGGRQQAHAHSLHKRPATGTRERVPF